MRLTDRQRIQLLGREVKELRSFVARLTQAVYTHTRTDIAPDAALPAMRKMLAEIKGTNVTRSR